MFAKTLYADGSERFFKAWGVVEFSRDGQLARTLHVPLPSGEVIEYKSDAGTEDMPLWLPLNQHTDETPIAIMLLPDGGGKIIYTFVRAVRRDLHFALGAPDADRKPLS